MAKLSRFTFFLSLFSVSLSTFAENEVEQALVRTHQLIEAYTDRLFPNHDPFAYIYDPEQGVALYERLKIRKNAAKEWVSSPLARISDALIGFQARAHQVDHETIGFVLNDAEELLVADVGRIEKQSNWLALRLLNDYLQRFVVPEKIVGRDGEEQSVDDKGEKKSQQDQQSQPPSYPDMPESYDPNTKDTEKDKVKGKKEDQVIIAEANFETAMWGQRFYTEIVRSAAHAFSEPALPATFVSPDKFRETGKSMTVRPLGKKEVRLFLPPLHVPLQPSDPRARISRTPSGGYLLKINGDLSDIRIPLTPTSETLMPPVLDALIRPVGFSDSEWPSLLRQEIFDQFPPNMKHSHHRVAVAQAISNHISSKYLYSVGARPEKDPIDALNAGAFQCDMAAFVMVGILRDVYQIPSRIVGGFRAKKHGKALDKKSYLVLPGEGHAWVEIYDNGKWHVFDPTPIKKDSKEKKDDEEGEKDEYSDRSLDNVLQPDPEDDQSGSKGESSDDKKEEKSDLERLQENTKKREEERDATKDDTKKETSSTGEPGLDMDEQELANMLELGSLELNPTPERNPLRERALRVLLRLILDPNLDGLDATNRLVAAKGLLLGSGNVDVQAIFQEAVVLHEKQHRKLNSWLGDIIGLLSSRELSVSYRELYRLKRSVELYARTLDRHGNVKHPGKLIESLETVLADISRLAHPSSKDIALVHEFNKSLPAIVSELLRQKYDLDTIGSNAATFAMATKLQSGELNDLRLLSLLTPVTDFILNSTPRPEFEEARTWQRDTRHPSGNELMPLQRFSELAQGVFLQGGLSALDNMKSGTAFMRTRRQRVLIPSGFGVDDAERITILLYDTSGSMSGDPALFQAGLISAFTARAISDVSLSGHHRHRVVLVPFDHKPHTPVKITNRQEALDVLHNYATKLSNTGGGTDIQKALLQAMALIADAEQRAGEPLAAANIILMTDGEAEINVDELAAARNAIDRETPLQTMFVAIGGKNDKLMDFARESKSAGFERGFYREFSNQHMREILAKARTPIVQDKGFIYSEATPFDLPRSTSAALDHALRHMQALSDEATNDARFERASDLLLSFERTPWSTVAHEERPLEEWLKSLRRVAYSSVFRDKKLLEQVVNDVYTHLEKLSGVAFVNLSGYEQEQLRHLLRFAAGLER